MALELLFLGTGAAFAHKNYHSNILITVNNKKLLIDAGSDLRFSLYENNLSFRDVDAVYVSHFHTDHIGGLEYLGFSSYFDARKKKIKLYIEESFAPLLWEHSLKGGLGYVCEEIKTLDDYFELIPVRNSFNWENHTFELIETAHVLDSHDIFPVYGLMLRASLNVYITGDTRFVPEHMERFYNNADIIIHDCETGPTRSVIHAHYEQLRSLPEKHKAKLLLWHYHDNVSDNFNMWQQKALNDGFKGFLKKGDTIEI